MVRRARSSLCRAIEFACTCSAAGSPRGIFMDGQRPDVSVAIVHYETPELLLRCLEALRLAVDNVATEVFVVDNDSAFFDPAACERAFPGVHVISNDSNLGFATASNQALRIARGRYLLLLNPDAFVEPDTLATMVDYLDSRPDVGCATCRVELEDGSLDLACRRLFPTPERSLYRILLLSRVFPRNRRFGQYNLTYLDDRQETEIDQPCGAFMMVRSEIREQVGLLDERYFMYCEDTDWAFRMKASAWRIMYTPITKVRHVKRASSRRHRSRTIRYFHHSMRLFYREHYWPIYPRWVSILVLLAIGAREQIELIGARLGPRPD
jgi:GT2 family glycosyltransferase